VAKRALASRPWWRNCAPMCGPRVGRGLPFAVRLTIELIVRFRYNYA